MYPRNPGKYSQMMSNGCPITSETHSKNLGSKKNSQFRWARILRVALLIFSSWGVTSKYIYSIMIYIPSLKLTFSPPKMGLPKRKIVFQPSSVRCYVTFREGTSISKQQLTNPFGNNCCITGYPGTWGFESSPSMAYPTNTGTLTRNKGDDGCLWNREVLTS